LDIARALSRCSPQSGDRPLTDVFEVLDVGDGRYVADLRLWGKGKRSGAVAESSAAQPA
jgi:hypothetical protein